MAVLFVLSLAAACRRDEATDAAPPQVAESTMPVAPAQLAATLRVPNPSQRFREIRKRAADPRYPVDFGVFVAALAGIPLVTAGLIDGEWPLVAAAVLDGPPDSLRSVPSIIAGVRVRSGRELVAALSTGNHPSHDVISSAGGLTLVVPRGPRPAGVATGVLGDVLLLASDGLLIERAAPFVARKLSVETAPSERSSVEVEVTSTGLKWCAGTLEREWDRARRVLATAAEEAHAEHGRRADLADPEAVLSLLGEAVQAVAAVFSSGHGAGVRFDPAGESLAIRAELRAEPGGAAERFLNGLPTAGVAEEPTSRFASANLALVVRPRPRTPGVPWSERVAGLFGDRITKPDRERMDRAFRSMARHLEDEIAVAVFGGAAGTRLLLEFATRSPETFSGDAEALVSLIELGPFRAPLASWVDTPRVVFDRRERRATVDSAPRRTGQAAAASRRIEVDYGVEEDRGWIAITTGDRPLEEPGAIVPIGRAENPTRGPWLTGHFRGGGPGSAAEPVRFAIGSSGAAVLVELTMPWRTVHEVAGAISPR